MSEVKRGIGAATEFHKENTGMPYTQVRLDKDGDEALVRVLQHQDQWVSLFMHKDWASKMPQTRCAVQTDDGNIDECDLCAHAVGRSLVTFIPVRVRGDKNETRVQFFVYGRNHLMEVVSQIEELPEGKDVTMLDFKVKRRGQKTDTKYTWFPKGNDRPLSEDEAKLVVPDIDELIPVPSPEKQKTIIAKIKAGEDSKTEGNDEEDDQRTPF